IPKPPHIPSACPWTLTSAITLKADTITIQKTTLTSLTQRRLSATITPHACGVHPEAAPPPQAMTSSLPSADTMMTADTDLIRITRNGHLDCVHRGRIVVADTTGRILFS